MAFHCTHCGYRSELRAFFRREAVWYSPFSRTFCHGCAAYVPNAIERGLNTYPVLLLVGGMALLAVTGANGLGRLGYLAIIIATLLLSLPTVIVAHELGHALAGWLVRVRAPASS